MSESATSPSSQSGIEALLTNPLKLPEGTSFASAVVKLGIREMAALSKTYLPILNSQPDFKAQKMRETFEEPFVL